MRSVSYDFESRLEELEPIAKPRLRSKVFLSESWRPYLSFFLIFLLVVLAEIISYSSMGIVFSYFQVAIVLFQLLRGKLLQSILIHVLFVLTSLEWPADLALRPVIYTYRTVSVFGVSVSTIVLGLLFVVTISKQGFHFRLRKEQMWFLLLFFLAIMTGFFGLLFSDYGLSYFISDLQYWTVLIMSTGLGFALFSAKQSAVSTFENVLLVVLCSRSIISFFGSLFGFQRGIYGGIAMFTYDAIDMLIPLIILALFRKNSSITTNLLISLCWVLGILNVLMFGGSGKGILLIGGVFAVLFLKTLSISSSILTKSVAVILLICFAVFLVVTLPNVLESNLLFSIKYYQALSVLSLTWITNPYELASSPRDRVLELYNMAAYYAKHPLFIITGRGFGGYFKDDAFYNYTASDKGGYSTEEVKTRKFANPHQSVSVVFLKFGLSGIMLWFFFLSKFLGLGKHQSGTSLFLRISGFVLILLFLGFSLKMAFLTGFMIASQMIGDEVSNAEDTLC